MRLALATWLQRIRMVQTHGVTSEESLSGLRNMWHPLGGGKVELMHVSSDGDEIGMALARTVDNWNRGDCGLTRVRLEESPWQICMRGPLKR